MEEAGKTDDQEIMMANEGDGRAADDEGYDSAGEEHLQPRFERYFEAEASDTEDMAPATHVRPPILVSSSPSARREGEERVRAKQRRRRKTLSQLSDLEVAFNRCDRPSRAARDLLCRELDLTPKEVQIWFQNKRALRSRLRRGVQPVTDINARLLSEQQQPQPPASDGASEPSVPANRTPTVPEVVVKMEMKPVAELAMPALALPVRSTSIAAAVPDVVAPVPLTSESSVLHLASEYDTPAVFDGPLSVYTITFEQNVAPMLEFHNFNNSIFQNPAVTLAQELSYHDMSQAVENMQVGDDLAASVDDYDMMYASSPSPR